MATSITAGFLNQDKRENEGIVVTLPSTLVEGGGRLNLDPSYLQFGETYTASVVPKESILGKIYLLVDEALPTGAKATVTVGGVPAFTDVAVDSLGLIISTQDDKLIKLGGSVDITITGGTGDCLKGELKVIVNYIPYTVKNGRFSASPTI